MALHRVFNPPIFLPKAILGRYIPSVFNANGMTLTYPYKNSIVIFCLGSEYSYISTSDMSVE